MGATINSATTEVRITFDRDLRTAVLDETLYTVAANTGAGNQLHTPQIPATALGNVVSFLTVAGGLAFPPMGVSWTPPPFDIISRPGVPAAAFADLPIVVV